MVYKFHTNITPYLYFKNESTTMPFPMLPFEC